MNRQSRGILSPLCPPISPRLQSKDNKHGGVRIKKALGERSLEHDMDQFYKSKIPDLPPKPVTPLQLHTPYTRSSITIRAAFSPIMIEGALVLPDVSVGMIDASAMRRPEMPWTRRRSSTTASGSLPILQVPTG